jgi:hypothetical protein
MACPTLDISNENGTFLMQEMKKMIMCFVTFRQAFFENLKILYNGLSR